MTELVANNDV